MNVYYVAVVASGRLAATIKLGKVWRRDGGFGKKRRFYAPLVVTLANIYLRLTGAGLRLLTNREWLSWEQEVWRRSGRDARVSGAELLMPEIPGVPLSSILASGASRNQKATAIATSLRELHRLHHELGLTHSDAATHNVHYEPLEVRAWWFDYESRHEGKSPGWRRAQDVAAFLSSAAAKTGPDLEILEAVVPEAYPEPAILGQALDMLNDWRSHPVLLQLIQAPWSCARLAALQRLRERSAIPVIP
ncbi:MAG: hypothetical protein HY319_12890 [Armatimonadetes bacterium]|nr:hypothetical protein [Armatimonadota bacterium]